MRTHSITFAHNAVVEILILERKTVIWVIISLLPFFVAEGLVVETEQNPVRMAGDQMVDIVGMTVDIAAEKIQLQVGMPVFLGERTGRK